MIIIIRALSLIKKEKGQIKKRPKRPNKKGKAQKRKIKRGTMLLSFSTLVLQSSTMFFIQRVSFVVIFIYQWEFFIIELDLYIPTVGFLKMPQVFVSKQVGCTPTQFLLLRFHKLIALVHLLHANPYSLTLISSDGNLPSPLIFLVDVRLSSPFLSSPQQPFYSTYSAISMAHAHVLREYRKSFENVKSMKQLLGLSSGLCMI